MRQQQNLGTELSADQAITQTLAQHGRLRELFATTVAIARQALEGDDVALAALSPALARARAAFEAHLQFEEAVVLPILRNDPPRGPDRAAMVVDEHRRQREMLALLESEAEAHPDFSTVAVKLDFLLGWLLEDMDGEERTLLHRDVLRDDLVAIDQATG